MPGQEPATLFYDADCGFCRATAGAVLAWDRKKRLRPVPLQDEDASNRLSDLSEEERMASWHLVEPDGSRHSGGAALVPLFRMLPRGGRLAELAARSPAASERFYRLVADHRDRLAKLVPSALQQRSEQILERRAAAGSPDARAESAPQVGDEGRGEPESPVRPEAQEPGATEPEAPEQPTAAPAGEPATGFPEPPGRDPGDISKDPSPHHALNNPVVDDPDPTEWPDPYERRPDPRDPEDPDAMPFGEEPHPINGAISTSEPHPSEDPEAEQWEGPKRAKLDQ